MDELVKKINKWWNASSTKKRWSSIALLVAILFTLLFFFVSGSPSSNSDASSGSYFRDFDSPLYYFGVIVKTIAILLLIVGGAIMIKRVQKNPKRLHSDRAMAIIESTRLSPKQALHLVRVGNQYYLVGATDQTLNLISAVRPYQENVPEEEASNAAQPSFKEVLAYTAETEKDGLDAEIADSIQFQNI